MAFYNELEKFGEQLALQDDSNKKVTYNQLVQLSKQFKTQMHEEVNRAIAFIFCENTIGSVESYLLALQNGIVPLLLNRTISNELKNELLERYKPQYLFLPVEDVSKERHERIVFEFDKYVMIKENTDLKPAVYEDLALLLTTSGSTGSPKLVRQSYRNIQSNAQAIAEYLELDKTEKPITTLPMNYTYGLSIINSHLLAGATIYLTNYTILEKEFWTLFKKYEITSFGGVPYTYEILNKLRFTRMNLPSLRTFTQAGGKLPAQLQEVFAEYAHKNGKKFVIMYGQTEATARMSYLPSVRVFDKPGSIGIAIPGGKFELIDEDAKPVVTPETSGELVYRGANVTLGYAEKLEDLAKGDERCGRLETGDIAKFDNEGFYYIIGRKKRFLKIYGNRINLDEIEQLLRKQYPALSCACSGLDEHLVIYVEGEVDFQSIITYLSRITAINRIAFEVRQIDSIPKNDAGKILYNELKNKDSI